MLAFLCGKADSTTLDFGFQPLARLWFWCASQPGHDRRESRSARNRSL